jgi:uncharacterized membrane protein
MEKVEKTIEVRCAVRAVYDHWARFENLPAFMTSVTEVHRVDDTHLHCHALIQGEEKELDAEIIDKLPNEYIAWKSLSGTPSVGVVHFESVGPKKTRVRLMMAYESRGAADGTRAAVEQLGARIQDTVEHFKSFIENRP